MRRVTSALVRVFRRRQVESLHARGVGVSARLPPGIGSRAKLGDSRPRSLLAAGFGRFGTARLGGPARSLAGPLAGGRGPARSRAGLALGSSVRPAGLDGARLGTLAGADCREAGLGDAQRNRSLIFAAPPLLQEPCAGTSSISCSLSSRPSTLRDALPLSLGPSSMAPSWRCAAVDSTAEAPQWP